MISEDVDTGKTVEHATPSLTDMKAMKCIVRMALLEDLCDAHETKSFCAK